MKDNRIKSDIVPERYEFEAIIGRGGMGMVTKAWDPLLQRHVAIKKLSDELLQYEEAGDIFLTEARAMASLQHRNLVAIYDIVDDSAGDDGIYMVQEFVNGQTLEEALKSHPTGLDEPIVLKCLVQLLAVVDYLHSQDVLHRDLKPANIMLLRDGTLRLVDFGLARSLQYLLDRGTKIRGTPAYMAPEQLIGDPLSTAVDIYQMGVSLFELLSGQLPFTKGDIGYAHVHFDPPKLLDVKEGTTPSLSALINDCLIKDPKERINTTEELFKRLQPIHLEVCGHDLSTHHDFNSASNFAAYRVSSPMLTDPRLEPPMGPDTSQAIAEHGNRTSNTGLAKAVPNAEDRVSDPKITDLELRLKKLESGQHAAKKSATPLWIGAVVGLLALFLVAWGAITYFGDRPNETSGKTPTPLEAKIPTPEPPAQPKEATPKKTGVTRTIAAEAVSTATANAENDATQAVATEVVAADAIAADVVAAAETIATPKAPNNDAEAAPAEVAPPTPVEEPDAAAPTAKKLSAKEKNKIWRARTMEERRSEANAKAEPKPDTPAQTKPEPEPEPKPEPKPTVAKTPEPQNTKPVKSNAGNNPTPFGTGLAPVKSSPTSKSRKTEPPLAGVE